LLEATTVLETAALDKYQFVRDAYLQRRRSLVHDGNPPKDKDDEPRSKPKPRGEQESGGPRASGDRETGSILVSGEPPTPARLEALEQQAREQRAGSPTPAEGNAGAPQSSGVRVVRFWAPQLR